MKISLRTLSAVEPYLPELKTIKPMPHLRIVFARNLERIGEVLLVYAREREELARAHAVEKAPGQPLIKDGAYVLKDGGLPFRTELDQMLDAEMECGVQPISERDAASLDLSAGALSAIMFFVMRDERLLPDGTIPSDDLCEIISKAGAAVSPLRPPAAEMERVSAEIRELRART